MRAWLSNLLAAFALLMVGLGTAWAAEYAISAGDLVRITVYDNPDLSTETRISSQGMVLFPLIGEVNVAGATAVEASTRIAKALEKGGFIKKPQVNLVVLDFKGKEVSVLGRCNRPGKFSLQQASKISDVLALAGGTTPDAADSLTLITRRNGKQEHIKVDLAALWREGGDQYDVEVVGGDLLYIPRESRFYIYGEVQRPGVFRLEPEMMLVQALSVGGGLTLRGTQKGIRILRRGTDGVMQTIEAKLSDSVLPDDVVYVKESLF